MLALIDEVAAAHLDYIMTQVQSVEDPGYRLQRFFEAGFTFVSSHLARARVMVNTIYGPDQEFKNYMYQAYQPMFQFVGAEIITPGIAQGEFRQVNPENTAALLMTIYLGTGSSVGEDGHTWLDARQVADFCLNGLRENTSTRDNKDA
jgi:hypothetical protein